MKQNYLILSFIFLYFVQQNTYSQDEQRILRDKYAFETAYEMYAVADTAAFTEEAALLIKKIDNELNRFYSYGRRPIEDDEIWNELQKLEPYRMSQQVQSAVLKWISLMRFNPNTGMPNPYYNPVWYLDIQTAYLEKDFDKVIEESRRYLSGMPINDFTTFAVRNNMALALMHQNKDLCALIELEIVREMSGGNPYFPALINLTVLYERLGNREEAESLSEYLLDYAINEEITVPLINFNAAWYMALNNYQREETDNPHYKKLYNEKINSIFKVLSKSEDAKYQILYKNARSNYKSRPISDIGLAGKLGFFGTGKKFIGILLFLIVNILLISFLMNMNKKLISLTVIGCFHILFWGVNLTGWGIFFIILSFIVFTIMLFGNDY